VVYYTTIFTNCCSPFESFAVNNTPGRYLYGTYYITTTCGSYCATATDSAVPQYYCDFISIVPSTDCTSCTVNNGIVCPTPTPTITSTPTPTSIVVPTCGVLFTLGTLGGGVYYYDVTTNTNRQILVPGGTNSPDIAHTLNKLWLLSGSTGFNEWNLSYTPNLTATYNRFISYPAGYVASNGLAAINDTTILAVNNSGISTSFQATVVEINVSGSSAIMTTKFTLRPNRIVTGDFFLTTTGKLILTMSLYPATSFQYYVAQYDYATGQLDLEVQLPSTLSLAYGVFEDNGNIYIGQGTRGGVNGNIYQISNSYPYEVVLVQNSGLYIAGSSQVPSCLTTDFTLLPTPTPTITPTITPAPSCVITYNFITPTPTI
jgi:hypothetical protein